MRKQNNNFKYFFYSKFFLIIIVVAIIFISFASLRLYYQDYKIRQDIDDLKYQAATLETKKIEILNILEYVKSDDFIEEKARTELNLIKPGEKVVIIKDLESQKNEIRQRNETMIKLNNISNLVKWWKFFTN